VAICLPECKATAISAKVGRNLNLAESNVLSESGWAPGQFGLRTVDQEIRTLTYIVYLL
jgi:hypothetical protein